MIDPVDDGEMSEKELKGQKKLKDCQRTLRVVLPLIVIGLAIFFFIVGNIGIPQTIIEPVTESEDTTESELDDAYSKAKKWLLFLIGWFIFIAVFSNCFGLCLYFCKKSEINNGKCWKWWMEIDDGDDGGIDDGIELNQPRSHYNNPHGGYMQGNLGGHHGNLGWGTTTIATTTTTANNNGYNNNGSRS